MATIVCDETRPQIGTIRRGVFKVAPAEKKDVAIIRRDCDARRNDSNAAQRIHCGKSDGRDEN